MADKLRTLQQLESLQAKYVGTGHADTSAYEWKNNIVRDSYASYVGHPPLLAYMALGMGESKEVVREFRPGAFGPDEKDQRRAGPGSPNTGASFPVPLALLHVCWYGVEVEYLLHETQSHPQVRLNNPEEAGMRQAEALI
ncbi:hypothetical protein LTR10_014599 [Elasticomyces elasticus]|uniref:Splicing factor subunit n=1 Tax=Exophiala sideris TaxID=1016849 RepID=A0ABR0JUD0_9EURO|nr:hypothetical protein LTR10_014599 [Elasticomyces elasticus]KAK5040578.1 hypothetical protein LTS07_001076 [Exophiala sideris]KAK5042998.1 hypothetical protein LTR13_000769 [Exophiala sideris]KAK5068956.1 hypothetical protein LTR69_001077 [Exophiala sideris]KAK5186552.1 hypothetical protein LTR44_001608 [Eurotiomycetes sp. CCFEE 6388]